MKTYDLLFRTVPIGIALTGKNFDVIRANPAFNKIIGDESDKEIQSLSLRDLVHPQDFPKVRDLIASISSESRVGQAEIRIRNKAGDIKWTELTVAWAEDVKNTKARYVVMLNRIDQRIEAKKELAEIRRKLVESLELERVRIAQDLHDGPMQDLHSINYQISSLIDSSDEISASLESISKNINAIVDELRGLAYEMRPPLLSKFGLSKAIASHALEFSQKHPELEIQLDLSEDKGSMSEEIMIALFRIYQQSLMNILKHAEATKADVLLSIKKEETKLEINDNGKGFKVPQKWVSLVREGHLGLAGSADRVNILGGAFSVISSLGQGTKITVTINNSKEY